MPNNNNLEHHSLEENHSIFEGLTTFEEANKWTRLANYFIDEFIIVTIYYTIIAISLFVFFDALFISQSVLLLFHITTNLSIHFFYYFLFEKFTQGKTPGKYATRTKVVTIDNQIPHSDLLMKRSLSRLIPFDAFSFIGENRRGWHDSISKTKVVKE